LRDATERLDYLLVGHADLKVTELVWRLRRPVGERPRANASQQDQGEQQEEVAAAGHHGAILPGAERQGKRLRRGFPR